MPDGELFGKHELLRNSTKSVQDTQNFICFRPSYQMPQDKRKTNTIPKNNATFLTIFHN